MNGDNLINKMMTSLLEISRTSKNNLKVKYSSFITDLDELIERYQCNQSSDSEFESNESLQESHPEEQGSNPFINLKKN